MSRTERIVAMLEAAQAKQCKQSVIIKQYKESIAELAADTPDMVLSAMPAKLQNLQDAVTHMEVLLREIEVLEELANAE